MLAVLAAEVGIPVICLAETSKFMPGPIEEVLYRGQAANNFVSEENGAEEVSRGWADAGLSVTLPCRNLYFELSEFKYFHSIITNEGTLTEEDISRRIDNLSKLYHTAFLDP